MKLLLFLYQGSHPDQLHDLVRDLGLVGHTDLGRVHGAGETGRREGTRAHPGSGSAMFSVVEADRVAAVLSDARVAAAALPPGERLHCFVLPVEAML